MRVCDRCGLVDPKYHNVYVGRKCCDMCEMCNKDLEKLKDVFNSIEKNFMKNKTLKHIDLQWEDHND